MSAPPTGVKILLGKGLVPWDQRLQNRQKVAGEDSWHGYNRRVMGTPLREKLSDAIRFWEIRRIFYNLWLTAIVLIYFFIYWPGSKSFVQLDALSSLFILAVLANVAYCAAYPVDVFVQMSGE